jgi:hypothetical protein
MRSELAIEKEAPFDLPTVWLADRLQALYAAERVHWCRSAAPDLQ